MKLLLSIVFLLYPAMVFGQLISPGKLISGHKMLEGITNCTSCHNLGSKGIDNQKCLSCHTPIEKAQKNELGLHGMEENITQSCASCHKDHFGPTFETVRFDTTKFDHATTTFALLDKHQEVFCADCHTPNLQQDSTIFDFNESNSVLQSHTFLGLGLECESCHQQDSPHGKQFELQQCVDCHSEKGWDELERFDHQQTDFPLIGMHLDVECASCHKPMVASKEVVQFENIPFSECTDCHTDVHETRLGSDCSSCHVEKGFHQFPDFPEATFPHEETGYALIGTHSKAECASCHSSTASLDPVLYAMGFKKETKNYTYPEPFSETCTSCHVDIHKGVFAENERTQCTSCHTEMRWVPSTFSLEDHDLKSRFTLTGAHLATPCFSCHAGNEETTSGHSFPEFRFSSLECESCHEQDNPHGDEFVEVNGTTVCANCHSTESWTASSFNHDETDFPLTGKHVFTSCESCHTPSQDLNHTQQVSKRFDSVSTECASCHSTDNPHEDQFAKSNIGAECSACHDTQSFVVETFDHNLTRFPLDGAHNGVSCQSCHSVDPTFEKADVIRFVPLSTECSSCHDS